MASLVVLTGFMGSGKTTVGRLVARSLDWDFLDLDDAIEQHVGNKIAHIFAHDGEAVFRQWECRVLSDLMASERMERGIVLALGGGTLITEEARACLSGSSALIIHLEVDEVEAWKRVSVGNESSRNHRPLASDREAFRALLGARRSIYESTAHETVSTAGKDAAAVAKEIVELVQERAGESQ